MTAVLSDGSNSKNSFICSYNTKNTDPTVKRILRIDDLEDVLSNIEDLSTDITAVKPVKYTTAADKFVYYQAGTVTINIDKLGHPRIGGDGWVLATSIPENQYLLIAEPSDITNLKSKTLFIPCVLSQGGSAYNLGCIRVNTNGIYIFSSAAYTYTPNVTYTITVNFGTAVY